MIKKLIFYLMIFCVKSLSAQAPPWQWAVDANSGSHETALDIIYDPSSNNSYVGGSFSGNLSSVYGGSFTSSYGSTDGFLAKYNSSGSVSWALKIGGVGADIISGVAIDPIGDVYVCGYITGVADFDPTAASFTLNAGSNSDGFLAKYSGNGILQWATRFGSSLDVQCGKMFADANGIYVTGSYLTQPVTFYSYNSVTTQSTVSSNLQQNMFGAKYNSSGTVQWVISGGSNKDDWGVDVIADANSVYFIGGYEANMTFVNSSGVSGSVLQEQNNNKEQVYILATSQTGSISWQTNITCSSGGDEVFGTGIAQDANNLYVTGYSDGDINFKYPSPTFSQSNTNNEDIFLTKLSKAGTFMWVSTSNGNGNGDQFGTSVDIDNSGNIILGGSFTSGLNYSSAGGPNFSSTGGHDVFVTSYSSAGSFLWSTKAGGTTRDYLNGLSVDNSGNIYVCGEQDGSMVVGSTTLSSGGNKNVFVAKLGCMAISNNSIAVSQTICEGNAPSTLSGSAPIGGNQFLWEQSNNSINWTNASGTFTNQNYSPPPLLQTTYYRRHVLAAGVCSVNTSISNPVVITVNLIPVAYAGVSQSVCSNSATFSATNPASGLGTWSVLSGSGSVTSVHNASSQVVGLSVGNNVFAWTVNDGSCQPATSQTTIYRDDIPSVAIAGRDTAICGQATTIMANSPTIGIGYWKLLSGYATILNTTSTVTTVNGLEPGMAKLAWVISNGSCPVSMDTLIITSYDDKIIADAGQEITVCANEATVAAIASQGSFGAWSVIGSKGSIISIDPISVRVSLEDQGTINLLWTFRNGVCPESSDTLRIFRTKGFEIVDAGKDETIELSHTVLNGNLPSGAKGQWSVLTGGGELDEATSATTRCSKLSFGNNVFKWSLTGSACPEISDEVSIFVKPLLIPNSISPNDDGFNDRFVVTSLTYFSNVKFSVFDRWGNTLYGTDNYQNDWAGTNMSGEKLTDDTYYYLLDIPGTKTYSGFINVKQNR